MTNNDSNRITDGYCRKFYYPAESIPTKDLLVDFLKSTKDWDGLGVSKDYLILANNYQNVNKLANNLRVAISRIRQGMRADKKSVPAFRFTTVINRVSEPNENGYSEYILTLGKANSVASSNKQLLEELL